MLRSQTSNLQCLRYSAASCSRCAVGIPVGSSERMYIFVSKNPKWTGSGQSKLRSLLYSDNIHIAIFCEARAFTSYSTTFWRCLHSDRLRAKVGQMESLIHLRTWIILRVHIWDLEGEFKPISIDTLRVIRTISILIFVVCGHRDMPWEVNASQITCSLL